MLISLQTLFFAEKTLMQPYVTRKGVVSLFGKDGWAVNFDGLNYETDVFVPDPSEVLVQGSKEAMGCFENTTRGEMIWFLEIGGVKYVKMR